MMWNLDKFSNSTASKRKDSLNRLIYIMVSAKHIGQPYSEFLEMPIPIIMGIIKAYKKELDAEKKASKRKK